MAVMNKKRVRFLRRYVPYNNGEEAVFDEHVAKKLTSGKNPWAEYVTGKTLEGKPIKPAEAGSEAEEPEAPEADAPSKREELEALTVDELKQQLGELGLPVSGNKADLVDRLLEEEG